MEIKKGSKIPFGRIVKFLIVGGSSALVNLIVMIVFVEALGFGGFILKNVANVISIEIGILYAFFLNKSWTWNDIPKMKGKQLITQFILFHLAVLTGISIRIVLFAFFEFMGLHYTINVIIGIGLASISNYVLYDRYVFREKTRFEGLSCLKVGKQ